MAKYNLGITIAGLGAAGGLGVSISNYTTPLSGITGSFGAGLVIASSAIVLVAIFLAIRSERAGWRAVLLTVIVIGILGTITAGVFLHAWDLVVAMVVALIGTVLGAMLPAAPPTSHRRHREVLKSSRRQRREMLK